MFLRAVNGWRRCSNFWHGFSCLASYPWGLKEVFQNSIGQSLYKNDFRGFICIGVHSQTTLTARGEGGHEMSTLLNEYHKSY